MRFSSVTIIKGYSLGHVAALKPGIVVVPKFGRILAVLRKGVLVHHPVWLAVEKRRCDPWLTVSRTRG